MTRVTNRSLYAVKLNKFNALNSRNCQKRTLNIIRSCGEQKLARALATTRRRKSSEQSRQQFRRTKQLKLALPIQLSGKPS
jgi:hypothetical protein